MLAFYFLDLVSNLQTMNNYENVSILKIFIKSSLCALGARGLPGTAPN